MLLKNIKRLVHIGRNTFDIVFGGKKLDGLRIYENRRGIRISITLNKREVDWIVESLSNFYWNKGRENGIKILKVIIDISSWLWFGTKGAQILCYRRKEISLLKEFLFRVVSRRANGGALWKPFSSSLIHLWRVLSWSKQNILLLILVLTRSKQNLSTSSLTAQTANTLIALSYRWWKRSQYAEALRTSNANPRRVKMIAPDPIRKPKNPIFEIKKPSGSSGKKKKKTADSIQKRPSTLLSLDKLGRKRENGPIWQAQAERPKWRQARLGCNKRWNGLGEKR